MDKQENIIGNDVLPFFIDTRGTKNGRIKRGFRSCFSFAGIPAIHGLQDF